MQDVYSDEAIYVVDEEHGLKAYLPKQIEAELGTHYDLFTETLPMTAMNDAKEDPGAFSKAILDAIERVGKKWHRKWSCTNEFTEPKAIAFYKIDACEEALHYMIGVRVYR